MKILNFGSLNIDYVYNVDHILIGGETLSAMDRNIYPGGKGLNQSVAFARAGANIWHAGAIGKADGKILLDALEKNEIKTEYLKILEDAPSGHTFIQVDKNGQNCILVYGGSNRRQTREQIDQTLEHFGKDDFLILQNEINEIPYIVNKAKEKGMQIVLNPSPMDERIANIPLEKIDFFMLNEIEAAQLVEGKGKKTDQELLDQLVKTYPDSHIIMTVGARGAYYAHHGIREHQPIFEIKVVDTTAAGDTFTGYFMKVFAETKDPKESLRKATLASTIAVSRQGASTSIPSWEEVLAFEKELGDNIVF